VPQAFLRFCAQPRHARVYTPFIANLKLPFKLIGHDQPNKPVNGMRSIRI
jgi:hypothetical protein